MSRRGGCGAHRGTLGSFHRLAGNERLDNWNAYYAMDAMDNVSLVCFRTNTSSSRWWPRVQSENGDDDDDDDVDRGAVIVSKKQRRESK